MFYYTFKKGFIDTWYSFVPCVVINSVFLLVMIGLYYLGFMVVDNYFVVLLPSPLVTSMITYVLFAVKMGQDRAATRSLVLRGLVNGILTFLLWCGFLFLLWFYSSRAQMVDRVALNLTILIYLLISMVLLFAQFMMTNDEFSLRDSYFIAFIIITKRPLHALAMFVIYLVFIFLSLFLFTGIFMGSNFLYCFIHYAVNTLSSNPEVKSSFDDELKGIRMMKLRDLFR